MIQTENWKHLAKATLNNWLLQTKCQDRDDDDVAEYGDTDEEQEAEYDSILVENAGELLPSLVKVIGGEVFRPHFNEFIKELTKKTVSNSILYFMLRLAIHLSSNMTLHVVK